MLNFQQIQFVYKKLKDGNLLWGKKCVIIQTSIRNWRGKHMNSWITVAIVAAVLLFLVLAASLVCFILVFYSGKRKALGPDEYDIPPGKIYEPFREDMIGWIKQIREMPHENIEIKSYDGLTLRGTYYEYAPDATVELLFHGYRGNAERDLCGGIERCHHIIATPYLPHEL